MKNKIIIDSLALTSPLTGIGRYNYEVALKILEKDMYDLDFFYTYFSKGLIHPNSAKSVKSLKSILGKNPMVKSFLRKVIDGITKMNKHNNYDLYWQPNFIPNLNIKSKYIVSTVHDFSFILYEKYHPKERIEYFKKNFYKNIIKSDYIITPTNFTKNEVLEYIDFDETKVKTIYHGVKHEIFNSDITLNDENSFSYLNLPKKYILCVGSIEPRKNLINLLKAYQLFSVDFKNEYNLVLTGFNGWNNKEIFKLLEKNKKNIKYLGYVSDYELAYIYKKAEIFVYPSFYEGFGLPPLESLACGTPVITSKNTTMEEVCKDNALYVNPQDIYDINYKIQILLTNSELRKKLIENGLKYIERFTWKNSANEHIKLFNSLIQ